MISAVPAGLVAVRKHPGIEMPGYCRNVPLGQCPTPGEPVVDFGHCLLRLEAGE